MWGPRCFALHTYIHNFDFFIRSPTVDNTLCAKVSLCLFLIFVAILSTSGSELLNWIRHRICDSDKTPTREVPAEIYHFCALQLVYKYLSCVSFCLGFLYLFEQLSIMIFVFSTVKRTYVHYESLPMTGFELQTSEIGSDRSTNWATTTALYNILWQDRQS